MATAASPRVGSASAIVGQLIIAAAEVIRPSNRDLGEVLVQRLQSPCSPQRRSERPGNGKDHRSHLTAHRSSA
ncbi:hypothetical protein [Micromonospora palomenae]|uniref:hypothetical protein n=1 Tax=Micromonospora palomenae TaxID=1461247 RepID=UPI0012B85AF5|nr:hypothetical protein [Micromonospora palomenae]